MTNELALAVEAALTNNAVTAHITDRRPETIGVFESLSEGQRVTLASDAWEWGCAR